MALVIFVTIVVLLLIVISPEGSIGKKILATAITLIDMGTLAWLISH